MMQRSDPYAAPDLRNITAGTAIQQGNGGRSVMRKKSHISLANYLVRGFGLKELGQHRKAFCLGSIMPDLNPKMFAVPHEYDMTFDSFKSLCRQILGEAEEGGENGRVLWRRMGVVMHYLADYFTYPHNASFEGNLKDHCRYESELKYRMRVLVWMPEGREIFSRAKEDADEIGSAEELFAYIARTHKRYMRTGIHTPETDCRQILSVCSTVLAALTEMLCAGRAEETEMLCA